MILVLKTKKFALHYLLEYYHLIDIESMKIISSK